jgi:catechol 2,3-dioxygenase-like lactoylglutathione lyase family enzyme
MLYEAMDSVFLAVADLDSASQPYERMGLRLTDWRKRRRSLHVGTPGSVFALHFLADVSPDTPHSEPLRRSLAAGRGFYALALRVGDLDTALGQLQARGVQAVRFRDDQNEKAWLPLFHPLGTDLVLVQGDPTAPGDGLEHSFPLKRLDHLAIVTHDLEAQTRSWNDVLGVPVAGEVRTPTLVIRQLRLGDAVLELLGPASLDSPLRTRPPGLVSMASWEVSDMEEAVRLASAAGFTVPDPAAGPLPGTRITTIPGTELAGVNMQLLQYV